MLSDMRDRWQTGRRDPLPPPRSPVEETDLILKRFPHCDHGRDRKGHHLLEGVREGLGEEVTTQLRAEDTESDPPELEGR